MPPPMRELLMLYNTLIWGVPAVSIVVWLVMSRLNKRTTANPVAATAPRARAAKGESKDAPAGGRKFCSDCGAGISPGARFCSICGGRVG